MLLGMGATNAAIVEVDYGTLSGAALVDFESFAGGSAPGTNYDGIIDADGVMFGERFVGQTVVANGNSDELQGAPLPGLTLAVGAPDQNLNIFNQGGSGGNVLAGLGNLGFPSFDAIGEGAVTMLFDNDQSEFGFKSVGGDLGGATFDFWARNGSLLGSISPVGLGTDFFGFLSDVNNIAGISIWNTDPAGIGFDDIIFDVPGNSVPEPGTLALMALGLLGVTARRSRQ